MVLPAHALFDGAVFGGPATSDLSVGDEPGPVQHRVQPPVWECRRLFQRAASNRPRCLPKLRQNRCGSTGTVQHAPHRLYLPGGEPVSTLNIAVIPTYKLYHNITFKTSIMQMFHNIITKKGKKPNLICSRITGTHQFAFCLLYYWY